MPSKARATSTSTTPRGATSCTTCANRMPATGMLTALLRRHGFQVRRLEDGSHPVDDAVVDDEILRELKALGYVD